MLLEEPESEEITQVLEEIVQKKDSLFVNLALISEKANWLESVDKTYIINKTNIVSDLR